MRPIPRIGPGSELRLKKFLKAIKEKDPKAAMALFIEYTSLLDKAAKTNLIHSKNADRKKSRMAKRLNTVSAAA